MSWQRLKLCIGLIKALKYREQNIKIGVHIQIILIYHRHHQHLETKILDKIRTCLHRKQVLFIIHFYLKLRCTHERLFTQAPDTLIYNITRNVTLNLRKNRNKTMLHQMYVLVQQWQHANIFNKIFVVNLITAR